MVANARFEAFKNVLPLTREWIEICEPASALNATIVLPLTREWIEIARRRNGT